MYGVDFKYLVKCADFCSLPRSRPASPALLSTKEEVMSFLQEVSHPDLAGYKPDRVLGLFKTQSHAGRGLWLCVGVMHTSLHIID